MKRFLLAFLLASAVVLAPATRIQAQGQPPQGQPPYDQGQPPGYQGQPPDNQGQPPDNGDQGQPTQGVGRISVLDGNMSTQRGDSGDWVADTINTPVAVGDALSTAANSRAEVQLDYANILRVGPSAEVKIADLAQGQIQVQVAQGVVDYVVLRGNAGQSEVDTQYVGILPSKEGVYRIEAVSPSETRVTVRHGEAQISVQQGSTTVHEGETIDIKGTDDPQYQVTQAQAPDAWDGWNEERDRSILQAKSWQYTDPYYTGTQDLDNYGQWQNAPDYGQVWVPNQGADWAPYSEGDWDWEPGWGWTWVSAEPWGWAPYHYGRWMYWNNAWAWWPGPVGIGMGWYRPMWAPAYVSFFGFGGFGLGFGWGGGWGWGRMGWLPVGPGDRFFPWWGGRGVNAVNMRDVTNIRGIDGVHGGIAPLAGGNRPFGSNLQGAFNNNAGVLRGMSTLPGNKFGQGAVRPERGAVTSQMLRGSSMMAGGLGAVPSRASLSATNRAPAAGTIRNAALTSHFAGSRAPSVSHESFSQAQASVRQSAQGLSRASVEQQGRANAEAVNRGGSIGENRVAGNTGTRSFAGGNSAYANRAGGAAGRPAPASGQSWQRFASPGGARSGSAASPRFSSPAERGAGRAQASPNSSRSGWSRFSAQPSPRTAGGSGSYGSRPSSNYSGGSRPPLQMNRPMFSPRSAPSAGSPSRGAYGAPSSRGYGGYSTPPSRSSGGYSAPAVRSAPSSGHSSGSSSHFGGGSHSSGGGHSGGGGSHGGGGGGRHR
jgi:hypothetical protein